SLHSAWSWYSRTRSTPSSVAAARANRRDNTNRAIAGSTRHRLNDWRNARPYVSRSASGRLSHAVARAAASMTGREAAASAGEASPRPSAWPSAAYAAAAPGSRRTGSSSAGSASVVTPVGEHRPRRPSIHRRPDGSRVRRPAAPTSVPEMTGKDDPATLSPLRHEQGDDGVPRGTLDRADVHNAFDATMEDELEAVWRHVKADAAVRAIVLPGAGDRAFCTGIDRSEIPDTEYDPL